MHYKNQPESQGVQNPTLAKSQSSTSESAMDDIIRRNQAQVREVTDIMQQNIQKALDRDISLTILENNVDNLEASAGEFRVASKKTRSKFLWKNRKWTLILIAVIVIILAIVILALVLGLGLNQKNSDKNSG